MNVLIGLLCQELNALPKESHLVVGKIRKSLAPLLAKQLQEKLFLDFECFTTVECNPSVKFCSRSWPRNVFYGDRRVVSTKVVDICLNGQLVITSS